MATGSVSPKRGKIVNIPDQTVTIGTATDGGTGTTASVAFTAGSVTTGGPVNFYTATSTPGSFTANGSASPITVSGLSAGTAYTFKVKAGNATGYSTAGDSAASNSLTISPPPGFESISSAVGNGSATTITFSSIPSTFKHLHLRVRQYDNSGSTAVVRVNGDSGTNYARHRLIGDGASAYGSRAASQTSWNIGFYPALAPGCGSVIDIYDYASTSKNKTMQAFSGWSYEPSSNSGEVMLDSGLWMNTAAITSISFISPQPFNSTSVFALYGIKGA